MNEVHRITYFQALGVLAGRYCLHRLTGRQAPLKGKSPVVQFVAVVKPDR